MQINERFSLLCAAWDNAYKLVDLEADEADKIMNLIVCHTLEFMLMVNTRRTFSNLLPYSHNLCVNLLLFLLFAGRMAWGAGNSAGNDQKQIEFMHSETTVNTISAHKISLHIHSK